MALLAGCDAAVGPSFPWVAAAELDGPLKPELAPPPVPPASPPAALRVVTFNVETGAEVDRIAEAILGNASLAAADVFLVQEIESHPGEGGSRSARLAARLQMGFAYAPARIEGDGTHGIAILSRLPLANVAVMELPHARLPNAPPRRIALAADVQLAGGTVRLVDAHLDTRIDETDRIAQLRPAVIDLPARALVAGDLNSNDFAWAEGTIPNLPANAITDTQQSHALDEYLGILGFAAPTRDFGVTQDAVVIKERLDSIYPRTITGHGGAVERGVSVSDHWPTWIDVRD